MVRAWTLLLLCFACNVTSRAEDITFTGYITDPGTRLSFEVNGQAVLCDSSGTTQGVTSGSKSVSSLNCPQHAFGEQVTVTGTREGKQDPVHAHSVLINALKSEHVSGTGLILRVLRPDAQGFASVSADGYVLDIDPQTDLLIQTGEGPAISPFRPNIWIRYTGTLGIDGRVHVTSAKLWQNEVSKSEASLRKKSEYDAAHATEDKRQGAVSRYFSGVNTKRMPAYSDPEMQARVDALAVRLVPAFQRALPDTDPTKIGFRFQLVDEEKYAYWPLPGGTILLSHQAAERMQTDDQLAALLALGIAAVLQKEQFWARPHYQAITAAETAGDAAEFFVPGVGWAAILAGSQAQSSIQRQILHQCIRISLDLLNAAGFDVVASPKANWELDQKKGQPLSETPPSEGTRYSFDITHRLYAQTRDDQVSSRPDTDVTRVSTILQP